MESAETENWDKELLLADWSFGHYQPGKGSIFLLKNTSDVRSMTQPQKTSDFIAVDL